MLDLVLRTIINQSAKQPNPLIQTLFSAWKYFIIRIQYCIHTYPPSYKQEQSLNWLECGLTTIENNISVSIKNFPISLKNLKWKKIIPSS